MSEISYQEIDCQYTLSTSLNQVSNLFSEMSELQIQCIKALQMGPDLINFPNARENWNKLSQGIRQVLAQQQSQSSELCKGIANLRAAKHVLTPMLILINQTQNPVAFSEIYSIEADNVIQMSSNALACFKQVHVSDLDGNKEFMEQLALDIGSSQVSNIQSQIKQYQTDIEQKANEIEKYEIYSQNILTQKKKQIAQSAGIIAQQKVLEPSINDLIRQKQEYKNNLETIQQQLQSSSLQNETEMHSTINSLLSEQRKMSLSLQEQNQQEQQRLQTAADNLQQTINNQKEILIKRINNPQRVAVTTTTSSSRGWWFWSKKSTQSTTTYKNEDTQQFKQKLIELQNIDEMEKQAIINTKQKANELALQQQNDLNNQIQQLRDFAQQSNDLKQASISTQINRIKKDQIQLEHNIKQLEIEHSKIQGIIKDNDLNIKALQEEINKNEITFQDQIQTKQRYFNQLLDELANLQKNKAEILKQMGYNSLQSLFDSLEIIEDLSFRVNKRSEKLNEQLGFIESFNLIVSLAMKNIIGAPTQKQAYEEQIQRKSILPDLNEQNYPQERLKSFLENSLKRNREAQQSLLEGGVAYFNILAESDLEAEEWIDLNISKKIEKIVIKNEALKARKDLQQEELKNQSQIFNTNLNLKISSSLQQLHKIISNLEFDKQKQEEVDNDTKQLQKEKEEVDKVD
ncbi:hypothetical protein ABPG72_012803 [Tetrahymena utriculariae]